MRLTHIVYAALLAAPVAPSWCGGEQGAEGVARPGYRNVSPSMEPTLRVGQEVRVAHFADSLEAMRAVRRGDVVLYAWPEDSTKRFVKRLVGLPGDTLSMLRGELRLNGRAVPEPYAQRADTGAAAQRNNWGPTVVPPASYFVLGDNRDNSLDSRYWGFVPARHLHGRVVMDRPRPR